MSITADPNQGLDASDAEELLDSLGFLLVPGPPFERGPAYLLVALRPHPTMSHFDPEQISFWAADAMDARPVTLEWPLKPSTTSFSWGTIRIVDRLGATNNFVAFGGQASVARDGQLNATLFRSDAPILCAGGHSGPADMFGTSVSTYFGILRAAAGDDQRTAELIRGSSPNALYSAFLERALSLKASDRLDGRGGSRLVSVLQQEAHRLQRQAAADQVRGAALARLLSDL